MSDTEAARQQAQQDHHNNPQTQKANEHMIRNAEQRDAYNAELERQRKGG